MHRRAVFFALLLAACTQAPPPKVAPPPPQPNALTKAVSVSRTIAEPRIRVGLLSNQGSVTFPRVDGGYYLIGDSGAWTLQRGFTDSAPVAEATLRYAVQVSAVSDKASAEALVERLRSEMQMRADSVFDPAAGLYKVLVGDFPDSASAQPVRDQLATAGYGQTLVVPRPGDQPFPREHRIVDDEGARATIAGQSLLVLPITAETVTIDGKPYRTAARVFLNSRGQFNIINELNLEDYLRGVVPAEMGPKIFDEIEALEAQAIAARTYAVRNLGQFRSEGYDICPGPACQAYKGFSGEETMTDTAVHDTAGLILTYQGAPIDALFTSTCGGETSDVGVMFPGRNEPYLKHVRCVELDMLTLDGRRDGPPIDELQMDGELFAAAAHLAVPTRLTAAAVSDAVNAARRLAGMAPAPGAPASARRGDVLRYLAAAFHFADYAGAVTLPEDRDYFFPQSAVARAPVVYAAAAFLIKYGFVPTETIDGMDLDAPASAAEVGGILESWLRKHEAIDEQSGKLLTVNGRQIALKSGGKTTSFTLPAGIPIFRRLGDRYREYKSAPVMIGDRAFVERDARKIPVALIMQGSTDGASFDRTSSFAGWTRSYRADELVASIGRRNPIRQLLGLRSLSFDAAHRVMELEVTAEGGRTFVLRGLPIRWSLNLPDNLFVMEKSTDPDGVARYTFYGKGWGHGVGMCQVGAYGMAFRGFTFDKILKWYYTGVEIEPMQQGSAVRPSASRNP